MTRCTASVIVNLLLCGLLALSGCKSSNPLRFAQKSPAGSAAVESPAATPLASSTMRPKETISPKETVSPKETRQGEVASSSPFTQTFKKATSWLSFHRSENGDQPAIDRTLDRQLTFKPGSTSISRFGTTRSTTTPPNATAQSPLGARTSAANRSEIPSGTPSLVRHSRRPPPDPAPKPPQAKLLAGKSPTQNPYATSSATPRARELSRPGELSRAIAIASCSWRVDMARAVATNAAAHRTSNASELKFSPPNIKKNLATATSNPSALAENASKTLSEEASKQSLATKNSLETIPRRQGMLAAATQPAKNDDKVDASPETDTKPATGTKSATGTKPATDAKWVAKRATPAVVSPEKTPANSAVANADSKRVVADTFANSMFPPRIPAEPAVPQSAASENSEFPLPPNKSVAVDPTAPQYVTNPHTAAEPAAAVGARPVATAAAPVPVAVPANVATRKENSQGLPAVPDRIAKSTVTQPNAPLDAAPPKAVKQRNTVWQQPLPIAASRNSYQAYYHRGVIPKANVTPTQMQPSAVVASQVARPTAVAPPTQQYAPQQFAPLVDAATYREQIAQQQQGGARIPVSASQPAVQGTWLAAYQKLVQGGVNQTQRPATSAGATVRSLSSER